MPPADRTVTVRRGLLPLVAALALPALVPAGPAVAQAVVQAIPGPEAERLAEAMRVLAQQPEDLAALLQAGDAALYLGDLAAAQNFYARARDVAPQDGRVAAGHAVLLVRQGRPAEALAAFDVAEAAGADLSAYAADRGLAYDLVGNNAAAQAQYDRALSLGPDDRVTLRLAISQAIAGNRAGFEATLLPLLQQGDLAAFRMRAFALAINGQQDEAVSIAQTMLPERLSSRLAPYLRYMPRLTRAQQAAAAHLGRFPQAHQIGQDDPAIAGLAQQAPARAVVPPQVATADARLTPSGAPLGTAPVTSVEQPAAEPAPAPAPVPQPAPDPVQQQLPPVFAAVSQELAPVGQSTPAPAPAPEVVATPEPQGPPAPEPVVVATLEPQGPPASEPVIVATLEQQDPPATELLPAVPASAPAPEPAPVAEVSPVSAPEPAPIDPPAPAADIAQAPAPAVAETPVPLDMAGAFAGFVQPAAMPDPVAAGGVDITTIAPPRERPAPPPPPPAPPAPPPVPSRHWVQLATGRDEAALGFDWRRIRRAAGDLLQSAKPHLAEWDGRTRLLAGPYSATEAEALVTALKDAGVDSFRFTSARGEEVRALD